MAKQIMLFLGNGFSIDLMQHLGVSDKICLTNLFTRGMDVPWPETDRPGFLSYQYCRNLWTLGARPYMDAASAQDIIERVITCANILPQRLGWKDKIYIKAYNELEQYVSKNFQQKQVSQIGLAYVDESTIKVSAVVKMIISKEVDVNISVKEVAQTIHSIKEGKYKSDAKMQPKSCTIQK